ncbi:hypothetical protein ACWEOO_12820 [Kribbella sp. NPDC004138]
MLVIEWALLRLVGRTFRFAREDVDKYLRKVDEARRRRPWFWARLPVMEREGLGDLHSGLTGLGFLVLIVVNLIGVAAVSWFPEPARTIALVPVVVLGAVTWTYLAFHAGAGQVRFRVHRDDWNFTITRSPLVSTLLFVMFVGIEILIFH